MLRSLRKRAFLRPRVEGAPTVIAGPIQQSGLWLDQHEFEATIDPSVSEAEIRVHLGDLVTQGYAHIPGAVSPAQCDELVASFDDYCRSEDEAGTFADENGHHTRLCNFHMHSPAALAIGMNDRVLAVLDAAFDRPAAVCSSLLFEKGSQQSIHRDTLFFHTEPANQFFGVWTALEDVTPDAGPLAYFVGGHRFPIDRYRIAERYAGGSTGQMFEAYIAELHQLCRALGFPYAEADYMRKGDVLIWHPQLPHGGSPIAAAGSTRRSIVFHYMPEGCAVHGIDAFFSNMYPDAQNAHRDVCGRSMIDQGAPVFLGNY